MSLSNLYETLDDLFAQHDLWVVCESCRRATKLNRRKLRETRGNLRLGRLRRRARRPYCGHIGVEVLIVWNR